MEDLQSDIVIEDDAISGTSLYVTDYTGFSEDVEEQSGNYLALHCTAEVEGATITARVVGSEQDPVTLDDDGIVILRLTEDATGVEFSASKAGYETSTVMLMFDDNFIKEPAEPDSQEDT